MSRRKKFVICDDATSHPMTLRDRLDRVRWLDHAKLACGCKKLGGGGTFCCSTEHAMEHFAVFLGPQHLQSRLLVGPPDKPEE